MGSEDLKLLLVLMLVLVPVLLPVLVPLLVLVFAAVVLKADKVRLSKPTAPMACTSWTKGSMGTIVGPTCLNVAKPCMTMAECCPCRTCPARARSNKDITTQRRGGPTSELFFLSHDRMEDDVAQLQPHSPPPQPSTIVTSQQQVLQGSKELLRVRQHIAATSLQAAQERLHMERRYYAQFWSPDKKSIDATPTPTPTPTPTATSTLPSTLPSTLSRARQPDGNAVAAEKTRRLQAYEGLVRHTRHLGSQCPSVRPLGWTAFPRPRTPETPSLLATAGWDGHCDVWHVPGLDKAIALGGHSERATCIEFQPDCGPIELSSLPSGVAQLASADTAGRVCFWSLAAPAQPLATMTPHQQHRISQLAFHPHVPALMATMSDDTTWRLSDCRTQQTLLVQEGHARQVQTGVFHPDGALLATGGLDANAGLWDLRSGRLVHVFQDHALGILSLAWAPSGFLLASGGLDHVVNVWDLRKRALVHKLLAHTQPVSCVAFQPASSPVHGHWLLSTSHDKTAKLWGLHDWRCLSSLAAHDNKILHAAISSDARFIATAGFDRSFKLWCTAPN